MHEVFRHIDSATVGLVNEILKSEGIRTVIRNWSGSNITSVPIPEFYPNISVESQDEADRSKEIIKDYFSAGRDPGDDWICPKCGESVPGNFQECWSCQTLRDR